MAAVFGQTNTDASQLSHLNHHYQDLSPALLQTALSIIHAGLLVGDMGRHRLQRSPTSRILDRLASAVPTRQSILAIIRSHLGTRKPGTILLFRRSHFAHPVRRRLDPWRLLCRHPPQPADHEAKYVTKARACSRHSVRRWVHCGGLGHWTCHHLESFDHARLRLHLDALVYVGMVSL